MVNLKDLKISADSLIHELEVAQESMLACMREEMKKLKPVKENVRCSHKNKVCPMNGIEEGVKNDQVLEMSKMNELHKGDRSRLSRMAHHMVLDGDSNRVVSSSYLTLPIVLLKPQFHNYRNRISLDDHFPAEVHTNNPGLEIQLENLVDAKRIYHPYAEFKPEEQLEPSLISHTSCGTVGLFGKHSKSSQGE